MPHGHKVDALLPASHLLPLEGGGERGGKGEKPRGGKGPTWARNVKASEKSPLLLLLPPWLC